MPDPDPTPTPAPDPTPDPAPAADKTFTQAELDRIVQERVARVKAAPPADYDDLKAAATKLAELEAANQTELEKAQARADKAEADAKAASDRARETALRAAVISEAAKRNVVDPDAAVALLDRSALTLDADGAPTNVAEAMDALLTAKPYLAGTRANGSADQGARDGSGANQIPREALKNMSPEEITTALAEGRLSRVLGGS